MLNVDVNQQLIGVVQSLLQGCAQLSTSHFCSGEMPLLQQQFIHTMAYIAKSLCLAFSCVLFLALFVLCLCVFQCHWPALVVSLAAQAAALIQLADMANCLG